MPSRSRLSRFLPFLNWPRPTMQTLRRDAWAGTSVGLILIPQAIAYATLAGMPPETGLYAALVPSVIGILFGSSPLLSVGPVALTSMLVFGSLSAMATPGSAQWTALAVWLAIYAGVIQFALGAFSLGRIANLVSQPVLTGFINAAAVLIIASQLPGLFGLDLSGDWGLGLNRALGSPATLLATGMGLGAILALVLFKRFLPAWPGILLVTIAGIALSRGLGYEAAGGEVVGAIPPGLPLPSWPAAISFESHQELWPAALIVALISFTEAMTSCRVLARKRQELWDEDQELIGQGMAKVAGGMFGAFPVSGSFSRSALNLYAGAVSGWSTLFSVLCVVAGLLFLTGWVAYLPRPVLSAMIIVPVFGLIDFRAMRRLFSISRDDGAIALVTFTVTLFSTPRLHWGVFAGVGLAMVSYLYRHTRPRIITVSLHEDGTLRDCARFGLPPLAPDVLAVRVDSALNFLSGSSLERFIAMQLRQHPGTRRLLLCAGAINSIDASGVDTFQSLQAMLQGAGVELYASNIKKQVWDVMEAAGLIKALRADHIFQTDRQAVEALQQCAVVAL
jgi:SulP family sulfate permease